MRLEFIWSAALALTAPIYLLVKVKIRNIIQERNKVREAIRSEGTRHAGGTNNHSPD